MSDIIKQFYEDNNLPKVIIEQKIAAFERHEDIAKEFELWITDRKYKDDEAVMVEGYTAKSISDISDYLVGEGAFILLIELREEPEKAKKRIAKGFKIK